MPDLLLSFITIRFWDVLDIILVAFILYQLFNVVKGTVAIRIFLGIAAVYLFWKLVEAAQMEMSAEILGQFIGVGVIALIIVFQQELRRFLLLIGTSGSFYETEFTRKWLAWGRNEKKIETDFQVISRACEQMAKTHTGALIVITRNTGLDNFADSGEILNAKISMDLLQSIFFKNSPLHDGAVIIHRNAIQAARCILPVSHNANIPGSRGLRHRAAIGITEQSDAVAITVSEQSGDMSIAINGEIKTLEDGFELQRELRAALG